MSGARFGWLSTSSFGSGASSAASLIFGLRASDIGQFLHFPCMGDSYCTTMSLADQGHPPSIRTPLNISMGRHRDPLRRFPRKAHSLQHHLVGDIEWLEVDVVVVLALEYVVTGRAARTDQHRAGKTHMHIVRQQLRVVPHPRVEQIAV